MDDETSPEHWFLEPGLTNRTPAYTSENLARPLIDGESYMADLERKMTVMGGDDFFFLCGWWLTPEQQLVDSGSPFLGKVSRMVSDGVSVRALVWRPPALLPGSLHRVPHARPNLAFGRRIQHLNAPNGIVALDGRLPEPSFPWCWTAWT
jgi:hypothetical protein